MKAWICTELTGEDGLRLQDLPSPACTAGQIKVRNHCASLNFPDTLITRGQYQYKLSPPFVPGGEMAGVIVEVGSDIHNFSVGQRVMVMSGSGAYAEEVLVKPPNQQIYSIPESMSFADAAAFNVVYGTSYHGLRQRGALQAGETLLVLGASGGCGGAAVELGKAMGATVIAGASNDEKCAVAKALGAHHTVNYSSENLRDRVMEITQGEGADVIFDPIGGPLFEQAKRCAAFNGRYLVVGFAAGGIPSLGLNYTILKSISVVGVAYGMSAIKYPAMNNANFAQMFDWYRQGVIKPHIGRRCTLEELPDALRQMHAGKTIGKTVVDFI
jgi:NADPH2:quinone reductase